MFRKLTELVSRSSKKSSSHSFALLVIMAEEEYLKEYEVDPLNYNYDYNRGTEEEFPSWDSVNRYRDAIIIRKIKK